MTEYVNFECRFFLTGLQDLPTAAIQLTLKGPHQSCHSPPWFEGFANHSNPPDELSRVCFETPRLKQQAKSRACRVGPITGSKKEINNKSECGALVFSFSKRRQLRFFCSKFIYVNDIFT